MFDLILPKSVYQRVNGSLPPFELSNMLAEQTPSAQGGVSLMSFPGLAVLDSRGSGPILGVFRQADLFGGAIFSVSSNSKLYMDDEPIGTVDGAGPVWFAASDLELCVGRGNSAYSFNGTDLQEIAFPDDAQVKWGTFIAGLFVFARTGSRKFYWSAVLNARTIDALDFASAESTASYLLQVLAIGDILYLGCKDKIEAWYPTGDATLPFLKISQRTATKGIPAPACMVEFDNALHFIGNDRTVYRMSDVPQRISDHGLEEKLIDSITHSMFRYYWQGHAVLMIRLGSSSYGYDVVTGQWHERKSAGENWRVSSAIQQADGTPLFGSADSPDLLVFDGWADASEPHSREFTAAVPMSQAQIIDSIELDANTGSAAMEVESPTVEMRLSRDAGNNWSDWKPASLGATGQYRTRPKWRRLGMFNAPGALFQFRVTDPVPFRVSSSKGAMSSAGRGRG